MPRHEVLSSKKHEQLSSSKHAVLYDLCFRLSESCLEGSTAEIKVQHGYNLPSVPGSRRVLGSANTDLCDIGTTEWGPFSFLQPLMKQGKSKQITVGQKLCPSLKET